MIDTYLKKYAEPTLTKSAEFFLGLRLTANQVTFMGFITGSLSGAFIYFDKPILGLIILWFSGYLDAVDGTMARLTKTSPLGTVLDVSFDRLVEASVILGLAFRNPEHMGILLVLTVSILYGITVFLTIGASAKNHSNKTFHYAVGLAERTEGFILLTIMTLFQQQLFITTLLFIVIQIISTLMRLIEAKKIFSEELDNK